MKKTIVSKVLLALFLFLIPVPFSYGQSLTDTKTKWEQFNRMRLSGNDTQAQWRLLNQCYTQYLDILQASPYGASYSEAKNRLREIHPFLAQAAVWYSSHGDQQQALSCAQAFLDLPFLNAFQGESFTRDDYFANIASFAASGTYNSKDYKRAIRYFHLYLETGKKENRKMMYQYLTQAYIRLKDYDSAVSTVKEALVSYPDDYTLLSSGINSCLENGDQNSLQQFLTKALTIKPEDPTLLNIQGKLYEEKQEFQKALDIFKRLDKVKSGNLGITQHIALNYYNLGVLYYNKAMLEQSETTAKKNLRQSTVYFEAASSYLERIVATEPSSIKYLQALAMSYKYSDNTAMMDGVNRKLASLGATEISINDTPILVTYSDTGYPVKANTSIASTPTVSSFPSSSVLPFSRFAKEYIEAQLRVWQQKNPYETQQEYKLRVTEAAREREIARLKKEAETRYLTLYAHTPRISDMELLPYDAENSQFPIKTEYGIINLRVPRTNKEAQVFESNWRGVQVKNPDFYISNDRIMLAGLTFQTPTGQTYTFKKDKSVGYVETVVTIFHDPIRTARYTGSTNISGPGL